MPIISDLQSLSHDAEIELFELTEFDRSDPFAAFRFCNGAVAVTGTSFNGSLYQPIACEIDGIHYTSEGAAPRPKLRVSDAGVIISNLIHEHGGLEGSILTLRKTLRRYLDDQATADGTAVKTTDIYTLSHVTQEIPGKVIEFELVSSWDFVEEILPNRRCIIKCPWIYRSPQCGYTGTAMFTIANQPTSDEDEDRCAKTLTACRKRFGNKATLPYGGFPGLQRF